jgi:hypothetical protein
MKERPVSEHRSWIQKMNFFRKKWSGQFGRALWRDRFLPHTPFALESACYDQGTERRGRTPVLMIWSGLDRMAPWALLMLDCSKMQKLSNPNLEDLQCSVLRLVQGRRSRSISGKIRHAVPHGASLVCARRDQTAAGSDDASGSGSSTSESGYARPGTPGSGPQTGRTPARRQ